MPAVAQPYGGSTAQPCGVQAVAQPYGRSAVAQPYGALAQPYVGPTLQQPSCGQAVGGRCFEHLGPGAMRAVALGQDAEGLPAQAGLSHTDFRTGEPVGPACAHRRFRGLFACQCCLAVILPLLTGGGAAHVGKAHSGAGSGCLARLGAGGCGAGCG